MKRPIKINHSIPSWRGKTMALVPIGMFCNTQLQKAENDSVVEFCDTWRREKCVLVRKCKVNVNSSVFTFLLQSIYGENMRWEDLRRRWEAWAIVEGIGKGGFSNSEVLLLEVAPYYEAEYNARQERKRQEAEQAAIQREKQKQEEERAKLLRLAKRGVYVHKDIIP